MHIFKNNKITNVRFVEDIGSFLKNTRVNKGLTQQELADKLNISPKTISKWENNNGFPDALLQVPLCKALGITLEELHTGKPDIEKRNKEKKETIYKRVLVSLIMLLLITNITLYFRVRHYKYHYNPLSVYYIDVTDENQTNCNIDGYYIKDRNVNILYIGNIKILTGDINDIDVIEVNFIYNNKIIFTASDIKNISINLDDNINPKDLEVQIIIKDYKTNKEKFNQTFRIDLTAKDTSEVFKTEQDGESYIKKLVKMGFKQINDNTYIKEDEKEKVTYNSTTQAITIDTFEKENGFTIIYILNTGSISVSLASKVVNNTVMIEKYTYNINSKEITNDVGHAYSLEKALKIIEPYTTLQKGYIISTN